MKKDYSKKKKGLADAVNATLSVVIMVAVAVFGAIFVGGLKSAVPNNTWGVLANQTVQDPTALGIGTAGQTLLTNIMTYIGILVLAIFFGLALRYLTYYIGGIAGVGRGGE
jgi:hypothetical protein